MTKVQSWTMVSLSAVALVIGVLLASGALTSAQSPTPTPSPSGSASAGTFKSNEDATHEASESAEREAQEDAGIFPGGGMHRGGGSNEDATHEASESAEREAQENAGQSSTAPTTAAPTTN